MNNHYKSGQHVKVKVTGIQPYGAFVETPDNTEGLIHISEIMNDYVHNLNRFLSEGQIVKAKILSIDEEGKLNLTLKIMNVRKRKNLFWMRSKKTKNTGFKH